MGRVSELASATDSNWNRVAFVAKADSTEGETLAAVNELREMEENLSLVFLDCSTETLVRRYKDSRRPHPLSSFPKIEEAIEHYLNGLTISESNDFRMLQGEY